LAFHLGICLQSKNKLEKFDKVASGHWNKIEINQQQIQTLETLRSIILSKLMSGEVRGELKNAIVAKNATIVIWIQGYRVKSR
jgi:hypothetical protein